MADIITVAVLFGGVSSEHDVSCMSAQNIINILRDGAYKIFPVYIDRTGKWYRYEGTLDEVIHAPKAQYSHEVMIIPGGRQEAFAVQTEEKMETIHVDVAFPVLHGLNGEDGTVQGLLEMARVPYTGCGILASALGMDKVYTKKIVDGLGIRQAKFVSFTRFEVTTKEDACIQQVEEQFTYPVFVKPSRAGSSVGASKAADREGLKKSMAEAIREDRLILVEEYIRGHEVECAVLGNSEKTIVSDVGEVFAADEFYSYDAKYTNAESKTIIPASISPEAREEIRQYADRIFRAIDGEGFSRVDFFQKYDTGEVVFNEINTCPGFTNISMWPMLMKHKGVESKEQVAELIRIAMERKPSYGA